MIDPAVFFPSEIVARIAEFVADEPPTDRLPILLALSSSSRSWHYAVQGPLYHSVRLRSGQRTLKFVSSISVDSNRAACVRAVSLVPDANSLSETIALLCKNIKAVEYRDEGSIDMFPYMRPDPVFPFLSATTLSFALISTHYMLNFGALPSITHLSLRDLKRVPPRNLASIFPNLTSLRLSLAYASGDSPYEVLEKLNSLPHLRRLSLHHPPNTSVSLGDLQIYVLEAMPHLDILEIPPIDKFQSRNLPPSPFLDHPIGVLRLHPPERTGGRVEEPLCALLEQVEQVRRIRSVANVSLPLALEALSKEEEWAKRLARWEEEGVRVVFEEWACGEFEKGEGNELVDKARCREEAEQGH